jgi:hypothetical protein
MSWGLGIFLPLGGILILDFVIVVVVVVLLFVHKSRLIVTNVKEYIYTQS